MQNLHVDAHLPGVPIIMHTYVLAKGKFEVHGSLNDTASILFLIELFMETC